MRILHIGDIVGKPGRRIVRQLVPALRKIEAIDFVVANGENSAGGTGITPDNYQEIVKSKVDCITLGDHIYRRKAIAEVMKNEDRIVKPANYPASAPGKNWTVVKSNSGIEVAVFSLMGRVFMRPVDCPWQAADRVLEEIPESVKVILVDFHAEATSDKQVMGRYLDGRVSSILGTHTHVPTADEQVLPGGTAFQCDLGMTGPYDSILGRRVDRVTSATITFYPSQFEVAENDVRLSGSIVEIDESTGRASSIKRICIREEQVAELRAQA